MINGIFRINKIILADVFETFVSKYRYSMDVQTLLLIDVHIKNKLNTLVYVLSLIPNGLNIIPNNELTKKYCDNEIIG